MSQYKVILWIAAVLLLLSAGIWIERSTEARQDLKMLTKSSTDTDVSLAEKIRSENEANVKLAKAKATRDKQASEDEAYRQYLDRPLDPHTRELFKRASEIQYSESAAADADRGEESR